MSAIKDWDAYRAALRERGREFSALHPELVKAFTTLSGAAAKAQHLDAKTRELIAVAITAITTCEGCMDAHVRKAKAAGATREEIAEALGVAVALSAGATFTHALHVLDAVGE